MRRVVSWVKKPIMWQKGEVSLSLTSTPPASEMAISSNFLADRRVAGDEIGINQLDDFGRRESALQASFGAADDVLELFKRLLVFRLARRPYSGHRHKSADRPPRGSARRRPRR